MDDKQYYELLEQKIKMDNNVGGKVKTPLDSILNWDGKGVLPTTIDEGDPLYDEITKDKHRSENSKGKSPLDVLEDISDYLSDKDELIKKRMIEEMNQLIECESEEGIEEEDFDDYEFEDDESELDEELDSEDLDSIEDEEFE